MRVVLTGATGCIGGAILNYLVSQGDSVQCIVRNAEKAQNLVNTYGDKVTLYQLETELDTTTQFYNASRGFNKIVHVGFLAVGDQAQYEMDAINGFIKAASEVAATEKVSLIITTGGLVSGYSTRLIGEDELDEANCLPFVRERLVHEKAALNANSENLKVAVVRPFCVYGGSWVDKWFSACKKLGKIKAAPGNGTLGYIHKDDLGPAYRILLENFATGLFNLGEGDAPNQEQVIQLAKTLTGVEEVEIVEDQNHVWGTMDTYGFFLYELFISCMHDSKRLRELYGWTPKYNFLRDAATQLKIDN